MRRLLVASIVAAGLAGAFAHSTHSDSNQLRRKTLGFGPVHPHATYRTTPTVATDSFGVVRDDPLDVARTFITSLTKDTAIGSSFVIRKDSYTDKNTGITHVYARQYLDGVEVVDGDINVNVKDGVILSYGDSVCLIYYCNELLDQLFVSSSSVVLQVTRSVFLLANAMTSTPNTATSLLTRWNPVISGSKTDFSLRVNKSQWVTS